MALVREEFIGRHSLRVAAQTCKGGGNALAVGGAAVTETAASISPYDSMIGGKNK